jgi:hypothetical protein
MAQLAHGMQTSAVYLIENQEQPPVRALLNDTAHPLNVGAIGGDDGITGLDGVPPRESAAVLPEAHGGVHGTFWMDRRPLTITAEIIQPTIDARNTALERYRRASKGYLSDALIKWFPGDPSIVPVSRINEVIDPSFEYDTVGAAPIVGWQGVGYGIDGNFTTQVYQVAAANPLVGANSLRVKGTKDNSATARSIFAGTSAMPVTAGQLYSAQASIFIADAAVSGTGPSANINWFDANGAFLSQSVGTALAVGVSGRQTVSISGATAPANAATAILQVGYITGVTGALDTIDFYIDAVQLIMEATPGAYVDGDSTNASWLGIVGQSASINRPNGRYVAARLQQPPRQGGGWRKTYLAAWVAADPRIYSTRVYNLKNMAPATTYSIENQGDEEGLPLNIYITGPGVNPTVQLTANGVTRTYAVLTTLTGSDSLRFDPRTRGLYKNGVAAPGLIDFANTSWPGVMPGINTIRTNWASGTTGASVTQLVYQDAWS